MKTKIIEYLENLDDNTLLQLHNEYCEHNYYTDDIIYYMSELDDLLYGKTPTEIINNAGDINTNDDYFKFTIYGVQSFDNISDYVDFDALTEYLIDNNDDLNDDYLRKLLDLEKGGVFERESGGNYTLYVKNDNGLFEIDTTDYYDNDIITKTSQCNVLLTEKELEELNYIGDEE